MFNYIYYYRCLFIPMAVSFIILFKNVMYNNFLIIKKIFFLINEQ